MSQSASRYARIDGDRYYTPAWVVEALLSAETFTGMCLDPAAGGWHIVDALYSAGFDAEGFDIAPEPTMSGDSWKTKDFFTFGAAGEVEAAFYPNILTNPPYGTGGRLAVKFIQHALALTKPISGKVAMLLRIDFDSANGRRPIFGDHPAFAAKYVLTRRIRWANLEQSGSGPTENHAWYVWDWRRRAGTLPTIGYLPLPNPEAATP